MILENLKMAVESIKSNRMRSFLTMLGIIIGIMAVIIILSAGTGAKNSMMAYYEEIGSTTINMMTTGHADLVEPMARAAVAAMKDGDVVLLQNTRFRKEETKNIEDFSKDLASLCDIYVDDAFGSCHRAHCSTAGVTDYVKETAVGYLMQKEIKYLGNAVEDPQRPFLAILGGAKVADKLSVIENLLSKVDTLIIGGGIAYT